MPQETIKQFFARIETPNGVEVNLTGDDQAILKETVQTLLKGGCRFEPAGQTDNPGLLVYHPTFQGGKMPLGWIAPIEVPKYMSVKVIAESRRLQAA
jgi:hypothetical protein